MSCRFLISKLCINSFLRLIQAASKSAAETEASKLGLPASQLVHTDSCFLLEGKPFSISFILSYLKIY